MTDIIGRYIGIGRTLIVIVYCHNQINHSLAEDEECYDTSQMLHTNFQSTQIFIEIEDKEDQAIQDEFSTTSIFDI